MNNILFRKNYFQIINLVRRVTLFLPFCKPPNVWLSRRLNRSWLPTPASAVNLLHVVLFIVYEENPASKSYTVGNDSILIALSDNCG